MIKRSKRYQEIVKLIDQNKVYSIDEAVDLLKKSARTKFDESIEVHFKLGTNPKKSDELVRGVVVLPHAVGKKKRIAVFAKGKEAEAAKAAGADLIGAEELIKEIKQSQKLDFDVAIAEPSMMRFLSPIAKILGPKGLMPNPKSETVTTNVAKTIKELLGGKITFRSDDGSNIHQIIGKVSMDKEKIMDNFKTFLEALRKVKPQGMKGTYILKMTLSSTMGPGIKINA